LSSNPDSPRRDQPATWLNSWRYPLSTAVAIVLSDQATKYAVVNWLGHNEQRPVIPGFFHLVNFHNTGAAWGILEGRAGWLAIFSLVALVFLVVNFRRLADGSRMQSLALALLLGGIVGNLIDRVALGKVIDFLFFFYRSFQWPAFNIADSAITVGVAIFIASSLLLSSSESHGNGDSEVPPADDDSV